MAVIILVRHGNSTKNELGVLNDDMEGFPLTQKGILESKRTADELGKLHISRLYSSPVLRCAQTAEIIGEVLELKPKVDNRLTERNFGEMKNKKANDGDWIFDVNWKNTGVETIAKLYDRTKSFIDSISGVNGIYAVVTHDSSIKSVFMKIYHMEEIMENSLKIRNSSMNIISTKNGLTPIIMNTMRLPEFLVEKISSSL